MCEKCQDAGKFVTEPFPGVYKVTPCSCQVLDEQAFQQRIDNFIKRWSQCDPAKS